jgi:hypothetical protein
MNRRLLGTAIFLALCVLLPSLGHANTLSTDIIGMFPKNVGEFAYADLRQARQMSWFPQLQQQMLPARFRQFEQFLTAAGVDPNSQVEELAWALVPTNLGNSPTAVPGNEEVVGVALGSYQPDSAEAYFNAKKVPTVKVHNLSLYSFGGGSGPGDLFFVFIDPSTAAFGQREQLEKLIAVRYGEEQGLLSNPDLSPLILQANGSSTVWAVLDAPYTRLAMQQLAPAVQQFPQTQQLFGKLQALTIELTAGSGVQAHFEAVCAAPEDANTFAALLQAGILYQRYQIANTNPDMASLLDQASVLPSGDRLEIRFSLTDDQMSGLIRRNTFNIPR